MGADGALEFRAVTAVVTRTIQANGLSFTIDEAGEGEDVALLLHGFPEGRQAWRAQIPAFVKAGWRVVAPDLRGYADSSRPKGRKAYHISHLTDDVAALFNATGARRRLLVGHDGGGIIAWSAAAMRVTPLDGLIVMNAPHPTVYGKLVKRSLKQMLASWYVMFFQLPGLPEASLKMGRARAVKQAFLRNAKDPAAFPADVLETYRANILKPGAATAMINYYRANTGLVWDIRPEQKIDTPTLLIWGEEDFALEIQNTEGNEAYVNDFALVRIPGASHWVQYDAADQVNAAMTACMTAKGLAH